MPSINIAAVTKDDIPSTSNRVGEDTPSVTIQSDKPEQKNKKRCWTCRVKLELAQRELGLCKCGKFTRYLINWLPLEYCRRLCVLSYASLT